MNRSGAVLVAVVCLLFIPSLSAQDNLALTPPIGWNSWNHFAEHIDDKVIREAAGAMVSSGRKDAGYLYINIDDTWQGQRDSQGVIHPNDRFPDMKALADSSRPIARSAADETSCGVDFGCLSNADCGKKQ